MRDALHILFEIILALLAALALGTLAIGLAGLGIAAGLFAIGWAVVRRRQRKRRE